MAVLLSSPAEVKALVPDFIFKRAKEVVCSNKLHDISFEGPSLQQSSATCTGSNPGDNYSLSISISAEASSNPTCQCSCPAALKAKGNLCKHVVALLLLRSKELAKVAKDQANAAVLSEFKLAEDRLVEDGHIDPTLSDSQATDVFVPSDSKVDNDTSTTASSVASVEKKNQKRVLPSWISEGYSDPKKEVKEKKVARKTISKKDVVAKEEGKTGNVLDGNGTAQTGGAKGKSRSCDEGATKRSVAKKRKDVEAELILDNDSNEKSPDECKQEWSSRAGRGNTRTRGATSVKLGGHPAPKRQRTRVYGVYVESDLSEEEEPEVLDDDCSFEAKEDLALTTEDLVNLATEHLETKKSNIVSGQCESDERAVNDEPQDVVPNPKKRGSIFSVQGWKEIANKRLDPNGASYRQETSEMPQLPSTCFGDSYTGNSQGSAEFAPDLLTACGDSTKGLDSVGAAENVVDDMLGLFFGPTLSKAVNSKSESSQNTVQDVNSTTLALSETDMLDVFLPVSNNSVPLSKKKSSLKDKVMMYLG